MKKLLIILISVALAVLSFAACDQNDSTNLGFLENIHASSINGSSSEAEEDSSSSEEEEESLPPIGEDTEEEDAEDEEEENSGAFWSPFV